MPSEKPTKQTVENCKELNGIIGLLAVDAETDADKMVMAGSLLTAAIRLYQKCDMDLDEINEVFCAAIPEYKRLLAGKKK